MFGSRVHEGLVGLDLGNRLDAATRLFASVVDEAGREPRRRRWRHARESYCQAGEQQTGQDRAVLPARPSRPAKPLDACVQTFDRLESCAQRNEQLSCVMLATPACAWPAAALASFT